VLKESEEIQNHLLAQDKAISDILERMETMLQQNGPKAP
jgi:hypothetical protein